MAFVTSMSACCWTRRSERVKHLGRLGFARHNALKCTPKRAAFRAWSSRMSNRSVIIGSGLLVVLAVAGAVTVLVSDPPLAVLAIVLACSVVTLGALGMWAAGRSRRPAMWVAVIATAVTALLCVPPMAFPEEATA